MMFLLCHPYKCLASGLGDATAHTVADWLYLHIDQIEGGELEILTDGKEQA